MKFVAYLIIILIFLSLIASLTLSSEIVSYYLTWFLFLIVFLLILNLFSKITKKVKIEGFPLKIKEEKESSILRKYKIIKAAIKGSATSRKIIANTIREVLESKYHAKLNFEEAKRIIKDREILMIIFPEEFGIINIEEKRYVNILKNVINKL